MSEQQMSSQQWDIAHDMAFELVDEGTDPNELGKLISFVRQHQREPNAKQQLMTLLQRMVAPRLIVE